MGRKAIDLIDQEYGRLKVVARDGVKGNHATWFCQCACGTSPISVSSHNLKSGSTLSCGCLNRERVSEAMTVSGTTHGLHGTRVYSIWLNMKQRCTNPKRRGYSSYGGRGISICQAWFTSFESFFNDMGHPPSDVHTLERKEVNGNYEPSNCVWATVAEQHLNTRRNVNLTYNGKTQTISQWAAELEIPSTTIAGRLRKGWNTERALSLTDNRGLHKRVVST